MPFEVGPSGLVEGDIDALVARFHEMHERIYTIKDEGDVVEFTTWKVRAIGDTGGKRRVGAGRDTGEGTPSEKSRRPVYIQDAGGVIEIPVYEGQAVLAGQQVAGPAIIEEETTTILLLPGHTVTMDSQGNYLAAVG